MARLTIDNSIEIDKCCKSRHFLSVPKARKSAPARQLTPEDWVKAGTNALMLGGIGRVKIVPLAAKLGVSTGSFYWHFTDLPALHTALLLAWEENNTQPMIDAVATHPDSGIDQFEAIMDVWVAESEYRPAWDAAVRDWARASAKVESAVRRVDATRIELLRGAFLHMGYRDPEALARARITYYHQVGYYALSIVERKTDRLRAKPIHNAVLMGDRGRRRP